MAFCCRKTKNEPSPRTSGCTTASWRTIRRTPAVITCSPSDRLSLLKRPDRCKRRRSEGRSDRVALAERDSDLRGDAHLLGRHEAERFQLHRDGREGEHVPDGYLLLAQMLAKCANHGASLQPGQRAAQQNRESMRDERVCLKHLGQMIG